MLVAGSARVACTLGEETPGEGSRRVADPSTFSVNLFGIPEIPEALPSAISPARLHNIVFISSCNPARRAANPFPPTALRSSLG